MKEEDARYWAKFRRWQKVNSSNVLAIYYDIHEKVLSVQFRGISKGIRFPVYPYYGVPPEVAEAMFTTGSKGTFVWKHLRDKYHTDGPK